MKHKNLLIISAIVVFSCAGFLTYTLAQSDGELTICVSKVGTVRLVGDGYFSSKCNKGEKLVTLSLQGVQGPQGEQGIQGEQGPVGPEGPRGEPGPKGDTGLQGEQGIQGEQGLRGIQGEQGLQGEKGDKGDKGNTGEQGPIGLSGHNLNVVDANGEKVGTYLGPRNDQSSEWHLMWDSARQVIVPINFSRNSFDANNLSGTTWYESQDCSGIPLAFGVNGQYSIFEMAPTNKYGWKYVLPINFRTNITYHSYWREDIQSCWQETDTYPSAAEIVPTTSPTYLFPLRIVEQ